MADSIAPVAVGTSWTDVYAASGYDAGRPLVMICMAGSVEFAISATEPTAQRAMVLGVGDDPVVIPGDNSGLWAWSKGGDGVLWVQDFSGPVGGMSGVPFFDPRVVDGNKAITSQSFTELNSKTGRQYEASFYDDALAASGVADIAFEVGDDPVLMKDVAIQFTSLVISLQVFKGPTFTGGNAITIYNMYEGGAVSPTSTVTGNVSTSDAGTPISPTEYSLGATAQGNRLISSGAGGVGVERVLSAGETYLFRITNEDDTNASMIAGLATWYQGPISVNIP